LGTEAGADAQAHSVHEAHTVAEGKALADADSAKYDHEDDEELKDEDDAGREAARSDEQHSQGESTNDVDESQEQEEEDVLEEEEEVEAEEDTEEGVVSEVVAASPAVPRAGSPTVAVHRSQGSDSPPAASNPHALEHTSDDRSRSTSLHLRSSFFMAAPVPADHPRFFVRFMDRVLSLLEPAHPDGAAIDDLRRFVADVVPAMRQAELERARGRGSRREGYQLFWQEEWADRAAALVVRCVRGMVAQHRQQPFGPEYELSLNVRHLLNGLGSLASQTDGLEASASTTEDGQDLLVTPFDLTAVEAVSALRALNASGDHISETCAALLSWHRLEVPSIPGLGGVASLSPSPSLGGRGGEATAPTDNGGSVFRALHASAGVQRFRQQLAFDTAALTVAGRLPALASPEAAERWVRAPPRRQSSETEVAILNSDPSVVRLLEPSSALPLVLVYLPYLIATLPSKAIQVAIAHFPTLPGTCFEWACSPDVQRLAAKVLKVANPRFDVSAIAGAALDNASLAVDYYMLLMQLEPERLFARAVPTAAAIRFLASRRRELVKPALQHRPRDAEQSEAFRREVRQTALLVESAVADGRAALDEHAPHRGLLVALLVLDGECCCPATIARHDLIRAAVDVAIATGRLDMLFPILSLQAPPSPAAAPKKGSIGLGKADTGSGSGDNGGGWPQDGDEGVEIARADWLYYLTMAHRHNVLFPAAMLAVQAVHVEAVKALMAIAFPPEGRGGDAQLAAVDTALERMVTPVPTPATGGSVRTGSQPGSAQTPPRRVN
jgi:hypothetical protein